MRGWEWGPAEAAWQAVLRVLAEQLGPVCDGLAAAATGLAELPVPRAGSDDRGGGGGDGGMGGVEGSVGGGGGGWLQGMRQGAWGPPAGTTVWGKDGPVLMV